MDWQTKTVQKIDVAVQFSCSLIGPVEVLPEESLLVGQNPDGAEERV